MFFKTNVSNLFSFATKYLNMILIDKVPVCYDDTMSCQKYCMRIKKDTVA